MKMEAENKSKKIVKTHGAALKGAIKRQVAPAKQEVPKAMRSEALITTEIAAAVSPPSSEVELLFISIKEALHGSLNNSKLPEWKLPLLDKKEACNRDVRID